ncbi:MAG: endolytic transglycosylase MltG [Deltaproteobacteria bacterium]|nr:endolytic transglycosylase MltG [Deltaproteobacteria bacterium]
MRVSTLTQVILIVLAVVIVTAIGVGAWFYRYTVTPVGGSDKTVAVWIKPGQGFFETIDQLQGLGLIRHPERFRWLAYLKGLERRVRAGEYALSASMSPQQILETLVHGETVVHKVVVAEGATLARIGELLERAGLMSKQAFVRAATNPDVAAALGLEGTTLEGYLFPETYHFFKGVTPGGVINKMVAQFRSVFTPAWAQRARAMGLSIHEVVTLASIVEKETADPRERPLIAAVFLNRLKRKMRLESDPTVIYGLKSFDGNLTQRDLKTLTPYNTYRIKGLPPGPICNPGRASIEAVLFPADAPYLYFVSKNDGTHHFSRTLAEHNRMVRQYQLRRH